MAKAQPRDVIATVLAHLALTGLAIMALMAVVAAISAVLGWWQLLGLVIVAMILVVGVIAADTNRQVRRNALRLQRGVDLAPGKPLDLSTTPVPALDDASGLARVLQAQYIGRLDRAQASFERAAEALHDQSAAALREGHPVDPDPEAPITVGRVDDDVFPVIRAAADAGLSVHVLTDQVGTARARLTEAGLAGAVTFVDATQGTPTVTITSIS